MNLTVLKAIRISNSIDTILKEFIQTPRHIFRDRNENQHFLYEQIEEANKEGEKDSLDLIEKINDLTKYKFYIKKLIGDFNQTTEINSLLNEIARLKTLNNGLNFVLNKSKEPSFSDTNNNFSKGCSVDFINNLKKEVNLNKMKIQNINDKCLLINSKNEIEIEQDCVDFLKECNLID